MRSRLRLSFYAVLFLILLILGLVSAQRPTAKDFLLGKNGNKFLRIDLEGQKRVATINEFNAVSYLSTLGRKVPLPQDVLIQRTISYNATLYDKWGPCGTISVAVSTDKNLLELIYATAQEETNAYLILDDNAPMPIVELVEFLVSNDMAGKRWIAGHIMPLDQKMQ